ncbi:aminotransferase class IV [Rubrivirga marina]|uniref:aminotransferase class IV n=1 Tax=Rubrivirga marina TaxID=1196024 RepID=UPI001C52CEF3|nr:aminotransferase class IV [Rubrivirga marina]
MSAPRLLETMRAEGGRIALLDRHLARLGASAVTLGYRADLDAVRERVEAEAAGGGVRGVRLTLGEEGDVRVESWPLADAPFRTAWIDPEPFGDAGTWRTAHKTTERAAYRARHDRAVARAADEAVLINGRGEVTEGTRTNVWAEIDGRLWTPPLDAGGLGGVMRAHVLDTRAEAGERRLTPGDLRAADAVFLSNALRGWMPVALVE